MKSPQKTGSSGSSTGNKETASHTTEYRVVKTHPQTKKVSKVVQAKSWESLQEQKKWEVLFDSPSEVSADDEIEQARRFEDLMEDSLQKEMDATKDAGVSFEYDVKELMAEIYQDLHDVAAAQASRAASGEDQPKRAYLGGLSESDLLLREVSAGVADVIRSGLAHLYDPEYPQSSEVWDIEENMATCLPYDDLANERYGKLAADHGWKFLSKLAHSTAFRDAVRYSNASTWQAISASIDENAVSLVVFSECCALDWWTELIRLNSLFPPSIEFTKYQPVRPKTPSPHKWVVAEKFEDVRQPTFGGEKQVNILDNIYNERAFASSSRPSHWPTDRPYPSDPLAVHTSSSRRCINCLSRTPCTCPFSSSPQILHPLVELRSYGTKGVGVRALQRIPSGSILDEYLGEVYPLSYTGDPVYALEFSLPGRRSDEVVATISAKRYGNWTRFVNHSCDPATVFKVVTLGGRHRNVLRAVRDIEVFEEVTVDYGVGYWRNRRCECGAEGCYEELKVTLSGDEVEKS